jgi:hypothetical protein
MGSGTTSCTGVGDGVGVVTTAGAVDDRGDSSTGCVAGAGVELSSATGDVCALAVGAVVAGTTVVVPALVVALVVAVLPVVVRDCVPTAWPPT